MTFRTKSRIATSHIYICPIGSSYTPSGATAATVIDETAIPTSKDAFTYLGIVTELKEKKASKKEEVWGASEGTGVVVLQDVIEHQLDKTYTGKLGQLGATVVGIINNAGILNASSTDYTPGSATTPHCWVVIQQMDHTNTQINLVKALVFADVDGDVDMGGGLAQGSVTLRLLANTLNHGVLGALPTGMTTIFDAWPTASAGA
jgi:hypothetical protein